MVSCLEFLETVYGVFGFSLKLVLSTRPEKYLGALEMWDKAEKVHNSFHPVFPVSMFVQEMLCYYNNGNGLPS